MKKPPGEPRHPPRPISPFRFSGAVREALAEYCRVHNRTRNGVVGQVVAEFLGVDEQPRR